MANHKSAEKRNRASNAKKLRNRYQHKSTRTVIKNIRNSKDKKEGSDLLKKVYSMLDKLAKRNIIHKNKAANLKSSLSKKINSIG